MTKFIFLLLIIITLAACQSNEPFSPGTKVEMICQEYCDTDVGSYVDVYESPGSGNEVASFAHEAPAEIVGSEVIGDVLYYEISDLTGTIRGWVTSPHVKLCKKSYC